MITRRAFVAAVAGRFIAAPVTGDAQTTAKRAQVGMLGSVALDPTLYEMFQQGLGQLGYTEGHNVLIVQQHADGVPTRVPAGAAELVRLRPDVIFARGPGAVAAAARATTTMPIVANDLESDPIALGYAKTLARPGGNVTGVFLDLPELSAKQLQLFLEIAPRLSRVALVGDPTRAWHRPRPRAWSVNPRAPSHKGAFTLAALRHACALATPLMGDGLPLGARWQIFPSNFHLEGGTPWPA